MKKIAAGIVLILLAAGLVGCAPKPAEEQFIAMDTVMAFSAYGRDGGKAVAEAKTLIYELEAQLSRTRESSEVSQLNCAEGKAVSVSETTGQLMAAAKDYAELTGGAFDITIAPVSDLWGFTKEAHQVPSAEEVAEKLQLIGSEAIRLETIETETAVTVSSGRQVDLGGIAKGYVSDLMEGIYAEHGVTRGTVSLGGNVYVRGTKQDGSLWQVGIQDPKNAETGSLVGVVGLKDAFAVTSGGYQRYFEQDGKTYHHILNPATGYPADSGLTSVTVVADAAGRTELCFEPGSGTMCDALSTALFVMGEERALDFWRNCALEFELILVTEDDRVIITEGLADRFTAEQGEYTYETVS